MIPLAPGKAGLVPKERASYIADPARELVSNAACGERRFYTHTCMRYFTSKKSLKLEIWKIIRPQSGVLLQYYFHRLNSVGVSG